MDFTFSPIKIDFITAEKFDIDTLFTVPLHFWFSPFVRCLPSLTIPYSKHVATNGQANSKRPSLPK